MDSWFTFFIGIYVLVAIALLIFIFDTSILDPLRKRKLANKLLNAIKINKELSLDDAKAIQKEALKFENLEWLSDVLRNVKAKFLNLEVPKGISEEEKKRSLDNIEKLSSEIEKDKRFFHLPEQLLPSLRILEGKLQDEKFFLELLSDLKKAYKPKKDIISILSLLVGVIGVISTIIRY